MKENRHPIKESKPTIPTNRKTLNKIIISTIKKLSKNNNFNNKKTLNNSTIPTIENS